MLSRVDDEANKTGLNRSEYISQAIESYIMDIHSSVQVIQQMKDEITFLRGHLSQLSEKLPAALPPTEEEINAKHWYQFWK
jgi:metal-responsive CopG/Arc/MetJ family transcriptional regulator